MSGVGYGGAGHKNYCGDCLYNCGDDRIGSLCSCLFKSFCYPCARSIRKQKNAVRAHDERKRDEDQQQRSEAQGQWSKVWEAASDNLCRQCSCYFQPDLEKEFPIGLRQYGFQMPFGTLGDVEKRATKCQCCSLLAQLFGSEHVSSRLEPTATDWGFSIQSSARGQVENLCCGSIQPTSDASSYDIHIVKSQIDWNVPRSWLEACQKNHAASCENRWESFFDLYLDTPGMRLLDVTKMSCILLPAQRTAGGKSPHQYAALSYTWGGVQKIKIKNPSREEIDLIPYYQQLPQTIKDAIITTKEMGLKFLWVDALCIQSRIEGDETAMRADEQMQFADMHKIYGRACFCIVAAGGESANDGLWSPARYPEQNEIVTRQPLPAVPTRPELSPPSSVYLNGNRGLAVPIPLPGDISKCKWASRAWCLQEQLFSTRYLVFFDNQIYFQCKEDMWFEDMPLERKQEILLAEPDRSLPVLSKIKDINIDLSVLRTSIPGSQHDSVEEVEGILTVVHTPVFAEYQAIVSLYSTREMTDPGDAINAVDGLLSVIRASMRTGMIYGLPESMFDSALLWRGEAALKRRDRGAGSSGMPSWSWAGWTGYVGYDKPVTYDRRYLKLVPFTAVRPSPGSLQLAPEHIRPFVSWYKPRASSGNSEEGVEGLELVNDTGLGVRIVVENVPDTWDLVTDFPGYRAAYDTLSAQQEMISTDPTHMNLWTLCIEDFDIADPRDMPLASRQQAYITLSGKLSHKAGSRKKIVGEIWFDGDPHQQIMTEPRNEALIVISSARYFRTHRLNEMLHVYNWPTSCHLYNVLLVELVQKIVIKAGMTKTYTVAYRKGIGRVTKDNWNETSCRLQYMRLG